MTRILHSVDQIPGFLKKENASSICVVTSKKLLFKVKWAVSSLKKLKSQIVLIPDGEAAKEWDVLEALLESFSQLRLDRKSFVIALGGGTVGDLAGFAASIYLRGIRYIQVPTTAVAQADSAHGGKTGIDFLGIKNQIGSFHLPEAIVIDPRFLSTLGKDQIIDGLGEIIKCGLIKDPSILTLLKKETPRSLSKSANFAKVIQKAAAVKAYYVGKDRKEEGDRAFLNFGHTFGHAIETKYGLTHGYAIILGCIKELELGERLGVTSPSVRANLLFLFKKLDMSLKKGLVADMKSIAHDKKVAGGSITMPLVMKEGQSKLFKISLKELQKQWKR